MKTKKFTNIMIFTLVNLLIHLNGFYAFAESGLLRSTGDRDPESYIDFPELETGLLRSGSGFDRGPDSFINFSDDHDSYGNPDGGGGSFTPDNANISVSVSNGIGGTFDASTPSAGAISVDIGSDGSVSFSAQSSGQYLTSTQISEAVAALQIRKDTHLISQTIIKSYAEANLPCPLTRLGMLGVSIGVADNIASSFYFKEQDLIILSKKEIDQYGLAVLDHELIHAGLAKAKKSKSLPTKISSHLARLNINTFSDLNGYVGKAQGAFDPHGYGSEEAMAYGWGVTKLRRLAKTMTEENEKTKINNFMARVYNNEYLRDVEVNGKIRPLYLIDSKADRSTVKDFLQEFTGETETRDLIDQAQRRIKRNLPNLCIPKTQDIVFGTCFDYTIRICGEDMRWIEYPFGCGSLK